MTQQRVHEEFERLIWKRRDGALAPEDEERLRRHLDSCPACEACQRLIDATARSWQRGADPIIDEARADLLERRLLAAMTARIDGRGGRVEGRAWLRPAYAAIPIAAAVAAVLIVRAFTGGPSDGSEGTSREVSSAEVARGEARGAEGVDHGSIPRDAAASPFVLARLSGQARVLRDDGEAPAEAGRVIRWGDALELSAGGRVTLEARDVAVVALGEEATATAKPIDGGHEIVLSRGSVAVEVRKRSPGEVFCVSTPSGSVEVRGTVFGVSVARDSSTVVDVVEGVVSVRASIEAGEAIAVSARERAVIDEDGGISVLRGPDDAATSIMEALGLLETAGASPVEARRRKAQSEDVEGRFEARFEEAQAALAMGDTARALAIYEGIARAAASDDVKADAVFAMGQIRFQAREHAAVARLLGERMDLLRSSVYRVGALSYLAESRAALGDWQGALEAYRELAGCSHAQPKAREAELQVARILAQELDDCAKALPILDEIIATSPSGGSIARRAAAVKAGCSP